VPLPPVAREIIAGVNTIAGKSGYVLTTTGTKPVSGFSRLKGRLDKLITKLARDEATAFCAAGLDRRIYIRHSLWVAGT
jgi:hypothetical protein